MFALFKRLVENVWRMNRSAKGLLIITATLVWRIAEDSPNFPAIYGNPFSQ